MFDGFTEFDVATEEGSIHGRRGGHGPPVLLLHGLPETHLMRHGPRRLLPRARDRWRACCSGCEEYRAAATLDVVHDDEDRPRRPITCPVLVLWSATGPTASWYDPMAVWREWADDVTGAPLDCGHFLPEEAPADTTRHLMDFLRPPGEPPSSPRRCTGSRSTS
jgi:pimeloyl-ACP methyl ester carboxylesterase